MEKARDLLKNPARFLALLIGVSFLLRVWGFQYGLEEGIGFHPDANWYANKALDLYRGVWPEPWYKESGWVYWQAGLLWLASAVVYAVGGTAGIYHSIGEVNLSWENLVLVVRIGNAVVGAATVFVVYLIGRRLLDGRAALIAAAFQAFNLLHVLNAHNHYNEVVMTFFFLLAFLFGVRAFQTGRATDFVLLAAAAFLSGYVKKPGTVAVLILPAAYLLRKVARREGPGKADLVVAGLVVLIVLGLTYWWHSPRSLVSQLLRHYWAPLTPWSPEGGWRETPWVVQMASIRFYQGDLLTAGTLLAAAWAAVTRHAGGIVLILTAAAYFFVLGGYVHADPRFILPVLPFLGLVVAAVLADLAVRANVSMRRGSLALAAVTVVLLLPSAYRILVHDYLFWLPDTRVLAGRWIRDHVPEGSTIWVEGLNIYNPPVYDGTYKLIGDVPPEEFAESFAKADLYAASEIATQNNSRSEAFVRERARLVKEFRFIGHQFHQPHIRIYQVRTPKEGQAPLSALLPRMPGKNPGGFSVNFLKGGGYDREALSFRLAAGAQWSGILVSPEPLKQAWIFVTNGSEPNRVSIGTGVLWGGKTLKLRPRETRIVEAALSRTFPYFSHFYRVSVKIGAGGDGYVRILTDPVSAAMVCLEMGEPGRAMEIVEKAGPGSSEGPAASMVKAVSAAWLGRYDESATALGMIGAGILKEIGSLSRTDTGTSWNAMFEHSTALDGKAYPGSASDAYDGAGLSRQTGVAAGREALFRDGIDQPGFAAFGPYVRYPPGEYVAEFYLMLRGGRDGEIARLDVSGQRELAASGVKTARKDGWEERKVVLPFSNPSIHEPLEFRVKALGGGDVAVRRVVVRSSVEAAFAKWNAWLNEAARLSTDRPPGPAAGGRVFDGGIEHRETRLDKASYRRGEAVRFQYEWRAVKPVRKEYEVFVHVEREGRTVFQQDHLFEGGARSVRAWPVGQIVKEAFLAVIPEDAPAGRYEVHLGLIDPNSRETVPASGEGAVRGNRIRVAEFEVKG